MRNLLSSLFFVLVFVGLGAMAFAAAPRGQEAAQPAAAPAAELQAQSEDDPAAPEATTANKYNDVALPLDVEDNFLNGGYTYDADGLASYVGSSVQEVNNFNAQYQGFDVWYPNLGYGYVDGGTTFTTTPFSLQVGGNYWLLLDSTADNVLTFVGDVPPMGSVNFTLYGGSPCELNSISIPLDQAGLTDADLLAADIHSTDTEQVFDYNAQFQAFDVWFPNLGYGYVDGGTTFTTSPFATEIGYPYWTCLLSGADGAVWP